MTYLQLVNKVLKKLRETQVSGISTEYSYLIGEYINEAKMEIEDAAKWKALRTEITFNTVIGQGGYNVGQGGVGSNATNERSYLLKDVRQRPLCFNLQINAQYQLWDIGREDYRRMANMPNGEQPGQPSFICTDRTNDGLIVRLWPYPDAVYPFKVVFIVPQGELEDDNDELTIPARPVWLLAASYAEAERTGGQGTSLQILQQQAQTAFINAVSFDTEPEEIDFIVQ